MTAIKIVRPVDFVDYLRQVEELRQTTPDIEPLWYRGCSDSKHTLKPSLYRHPTELNAAKLRALERSLMTRFRQRSVPYQERSLEDPWEALFFMQHYRVPTRLLDWTESPFIGLFFAVMTAEKDKHGKFPVDASIWVLNPVAWNQHSLRHLSYPGGILSTGDELLRGYSPQASEGESAELPVALSGAHNSPRIVAQRGVFTIFGHSQRSMESLYRARTMRPNALAKIVIARGKIEKFRRALIDHGITESVVFPDLEGLGQEFRRHFGFSK